MSDDNKRDRALQRRVRERQAKTGESYQAAWRHLTASETPPSSNPNARNARKGARRVPLSLSTSWDGKVLPGESAQITVRPQLASFWPDRVLIKNADRWDIHRLAVGNHEASEFSLIETGSRKSCKATVFALDVWQPLTTREIVCGESIIVEVTYTGSNAKGENFEATLFGWEGCRPPTTSTDRREEDDRISERVASGNVPTGKTVQLPLTVAAPTLFVDRLTLADAKDWVVNDVRTHGKSILVQSGDLPGEMFSDSARVILEPLKAGSLVEIVATYIGSSAFARLQIELSGFTKPPSTPRELSCFLPMSTGVPILPTQSAQITGRPQVDFLPERLVISDPDAWIIDDITIGIRRQPASLGALPGQSFSSRTVGSHMTLDPVRRGQDFVLVVTRGDDCKVDAPFFCGVQGRCIPGIPGVLVAAPSYDPAGSSA